MCPFVNQTKMCGTGRTISSKRWAWPHEARFPEHVPPTALPAWSPQTFGLFWEGSPGKTGLGCVGCAVFLMTEHRCGAEAAIDYSKTNGHNCTSMKLGLHTLKMVIMSFPYYKVFFFWLFPLLNSIKFILGWPTFQQNGGRLYLSQGQVLGQFPI